MPKGTKVISKMSFASTARQLCAKRYNQNMAKQHDLTFHTSTAEAGSTLAQALRHWQPGYSWSEVRHWIASRKVQVNGNLCLDPARRLKEGEVVKWLVHALPAPPEPDQLKLRYIDEHLLVVEKPAGVTTMRHPEERFWPDRRKQKQHTLDEMLQKLVEQHGRRTSRRAHKPWQRVRAVHRLDRDTSGLMVFARTVEAERHLVKQFAAHAIHRLYQAVVIGQLKEPQTIRSRLVRDRGDGRRGSTTDPNEGQMAVTHIKPLRILRDYTMIECRLETGRTHQIRIHLAEAQHPVCGEPIYMKPLHGPARSDPSGAPRLALHAAELGFEHPVTGQPLRFAMPWPADLSRWWEKLVQHHEANSGKAKPSG